MQGCDTWARLLWNNGSDLQHITVSESGDYWLQVANACGTSVDTIKVDFEPCDIVFPNAFTPNGDGRDDIARVVGHLDLYRDFPLSIYNRFGQRVFFTNDIYAGWDGIFNGTKQDIGTFFYMIFYSLEGRKHMMKGDLELIR